MKANCWLFGILVEPLIMLGLFFGLLRYIAGTGDNIHRLV